MRYKEFRLSLSEQTAPGKVSIVVYFEDNTTQVIDNIPLSVFNGPDFMSQLRDRLSRKYNKIVVRYSKVGDTTTQGNPDGKTPNTTTPTVMTTTKPSDDKVSQKPDEVEAPTKTDKGDNLMQVDFISSQDLDNMTAASAAQDERKKTIDKNGDGKDDKTGKVLPVIYNDGSLRDPFNTEKIVGYVPGATPVAKKGGGSAGAEGEGGEEGQEGGPGSIIGDLYDAITGPGTNETKLIDALKRIKSPAQLNQVVRSYKEAHNSSLPDDIINEFFYDLGNNTPSVIEEVNNVMVPLGWRIVGNRYSTLRWEKVTGNS
jgi:hypothetical protein